jgi:hypothetical protein
MQQKRQDIVEEALAIIRAFESRKGVVRTPVNHRKTTLNRLFYIALGALFATALSFILRVSLFR